MTITDWKGGNFEIQVNDEVRTIKNMSILKSKADSNVNRKARGTSDVMTWEKEGDILMSTSA